MTVHFLAREININRGPVYILHGGMHMSKIVDTFPLTETCQMCPKHFQHILQE